MAKLLGRAPNQVPTNADLGTMAFQDREGINVNNAIVANLVVTGATTVNTPFAVANSSTNVAYYASNGNVGVGTSTPGSKLTVYGNTAYFGAFNTTGGTSVFIDSPTAQTAAVIYRQGGGNAVDIGTRKSNNSVLTIRETASGAERITFVANSTSGAIAVNNAAPSTGHVLSVVGNTYLDSDRLFLYSVTSNSGPFMQFYTANTASYEALRFLHPGGNTAFDAGYDTGASAYYINRFDTAGAYVDRSFFIGRANGNVGIANVTPDAKLAVTGTANISGNVTFGGTSFVVTNAGNTTFVANGTTGDVKIYRDSAGGGQYLSITQGAGGHQITGYSSLNNQKPIVLNATAVGNTNYDYGVTLQVEGVTKFNVNATSARVSTDLLSTAGNTSLGNTTITGNLTVTGTTTYVNTTNLNVGDNIITLNADVSGAPSENAGIEINRGTSSNTSLYWDETNKRWTAYGGNDANVAFMVASNTYARSFYTSSGSLVDQWGTVAQPGSIMEIAVASGVNLIDNKARSFLISNGSVNTAIFAANGNIGFGNTTPTDKLVVGGGNIKVFGIGTLATQYADIRLLHDGTATANGYRWAIDGNSPQNLYLQYTNDGFSSTAVGRMYVSGANGNIGVNNSAPTSKLTVGGTIRSTTGDVFIDNGYLFLGNTGANTTPSIVKYAGNTSVSYRLDIPNLGGNSTISAGAFWNGMHLSGPEGIANSTSGTTYPRTSLFYSYTSNNNPSDLYFNIWNGNNGGTGGVNVGTKIYSISGVDGTARGIDIAANGNIGISNTAPAAKLHVTSAANNYEASVIVNNANTTGAGAEAKIHFVSNGFTTFLGQSPSSFTFLTGSSGNALNLYGGVGAGTILGANAVANVMYLVANTNVGIGNSAPADKLSVNGSIYSNNLRRYTAVRALPTTVNDTIEVGTLTHSSGGHSLKIGLHVSDANFSVAKQYTITSGYNATGATYRKLLPDQDSGQYSTNDFDLEAYHNNDTIGLRLRRTSGSNAGNVHIMIDDKSIEATDTDAFTPSSTTATGVAALTDLFPGNRLLQSGLGGSNSFIVAANLTTNAITSNNTATVFNLPTTFSSVVSVGGASLGYATLTTSATTANQVIDNSLSTSVYRSVKYFVQVTSGSAYQATEITLIHDGTNVYKSEYGTVYSGAVLATFDADINSGNIRLLTTPVNAVTVYKASKTVIVV